MPWSDETALPEPDAGPPPPVVQQPFDEFALQRQQAEALPERKPTVMQPDLQSSQMGEQDTPEGYAVNDAGQVFHKQTGEVLPPTRRPSVLPLTRTPEGQYEPAMPRIADIAGNMGAGWNVPVKGAETVLGAGLVKGAKALPGKAGREALYDLPPEQVNTFEKITGKMGTHPGGVYADPTNGERWYIKNTPTWDHAKNEKLAAELYKLAGVPTADTRLTTLNGKPAIASKWIQGEELNKVWDVAGNNEIKGLQENLPADVWTANYDSVGTGKNNIIVDAQGNAHRIDLGGALRYRAQGAPKPWWGNKVTEHQSMLDPKINMDASDVFNGADIGKQQQSASRIANVSDNQIVDLVTKYGPHVGKIKLTNELKARRDQVADIYGGQVKPKLDVIEGGKQKIPYAGDQEIIPYKGISAREDAAAMMDNNKFQGTSPAEYDVPGMASDIYRLAGQYPNFTKVLQHFLPPELKPALDKEISKLVKRSDFDPWFTPSGNYSSTPPKVAPVLQNLKPMQLNKAHHTPDFVNGLKDLSFADANPKIVTPKQQSKIMDMMNQQHNADDIADAVYNGPYSQKQKENILSWMNPKKKSEVEHVLNNPKGLSQDELDQLEYEMKQNQQFQHETNIHAGGEFTGQEYKAKTGKEFKKLGNPYADLIDVKDAKWFQKWKPLEQKQFPSPQWGPNLKEKARLLGFNTEAVFGHGSSYHYSGVGASSYPAELKPATHKSYESGFFTGIDPEVPKGYGSNIQTYVARPQKVGVVDWHDLRLQMEGVEGKFGYTGQHMDPLINAGHKLGVDLLVVNRIRDIAQYGNKLQTQYIFLNPAVLRAPTAKFDPAKLHLAHPLAGVAGGGIFAYGAMQGIGGGQRNQQQFAIGGRAKVAKPVVNYSKGMPQSHCGICRFYHDKTCTKVQGKIDPAYWCRLYEKKD
jgi:hypothetical protein